MKVTLDQVFLLNRRMGDTVYAIEIDNTLVASSVSRSYVIGNYLDDMINPLGNLTPPEL